MSKSKKILVQRISSELPYRRTSGPLWQPAVDIYRCPGGLKVKFDLAGVTPDEVQVLVTNDQLIVRGVRRDSLITEGWTYQQLEITYSRFERVLKLPYDLSDAEIRSEYRDGWFMLHINCNRQE